MRESVTPVSIYKIVVPDRFVLALSRSACAPSVHRSIRRDIRVCQLTWI
jgi:hypothetical protein